MERIYFSINEELAFNARKQWSFTDYVKGTITEEYKQSVNEVYDLVEKVQQNNEQYFEEAYKIAISYSKKLAEWWNTKHSIDMMCPSIMICGGANFPTRKKEKQVSRMGSHYKELDYINSLPKKIEKILKGEAIIKSSDENAIEKLEQKLNDLVELQEGMKKANVYYKKNKTFEGFTNLKQETINNVIELMKNDWYGDKPFPTYSLTNNNAKIKNTKARIEKLKQEKEKGTQEVIVETEENSSYKVVENTDLMRLQLLFNDKPNEQVRDLLKKNGFRWSPKNSAWQRQLTENARYAFKRISDQLKEIA